MAGAVCRAGVDCIDQGFNTIDAFAFADLVGAVLMRTVIAALTVLLFFRLPCALALKTSMPTCPGAMIFDLVPAGESWGRVTFRLPRRKDVWMPRTLLDVPVTR